MMPTRWQKVVIDLWQNRVRTLIVALAVAVGVYAVGVVVDTRQVLVREYRSDQSGALPASALVYTYPFDDDLAASIARVPGVAAAEGRTAVHTRAYDGAGRPVNLILLAVPDLTNMQLDAVTPLSGKWPPGDREVILERQAFDYLGTGIGSSLTLELDNGTTKTLAVVGSGHDAEQVGPGIAGEAYGYIVPETMHSLGLETSYTELRIRVAERPHDEQHIRSVLAQVENKLQQSGRLVLSTRVITHSVAGPFIDTVVLILTIFGLVILLLSGFLVVNSMSALIAQQIPQIGVMKLIGARRSQVISLYLVAVLVYGILAVTLAVPLAMLTARLLMSEMVNGLLNIMPESYAVPLPLVAVQVVVGLVLPVLAGLAPVLRGTRITTQRALNDVGVDAEGYGKGLVNRLLARLEQAWSFRRPVLLSIRNTLRHKGRLLQTLVVLTFGSALFIAVLSVRSSVTATLDAFMSFHRYDVSVELQQPDRSVRLEQAARSVPGVVDVEVWSVGHATRAGTGPATSDGFRLYALPAGTTFADPQVTAGRWLPHARSAGIRNPLVVNTDLLDEEPDIRIGSQLRLEIAGREDTWQVVGIVPTEARGAAAYAWLDDYAYATRATGMGTTVQVQTARHDAAGQQAMAALLFERFEALGIEVGSTQTTQLIRYENNLMFTIVIAFLILMALLLAAVGGLGLTTTMSINVMERVREIGVLRAIGASNASVRQIVLAEGMVMCAVSWAIGTLLSLPIGSLMSEQMGLSLIKMPFSYHYSVVAAIAWFFVLQLVAVAASLGPARKAVKLTVREVLAYE